MLDQQWLIGSAADCDLLIDAPTVSAHHCRLSRIGKQYFLEDCGSTNGTYCDGQRITAKTPIQPAAAITLGRSFVCPWPDSAGAKQIVFVGRDRENDFWLDRPNVSSLHARFMVGQQDTWVVEDLDSTNGVAIELRGVRHRIQKAVAVQPDQTVYFGSTPVTVEALIETASRLPPRPLPPSGKGPSGKGTSGKSQSAASEVGKSGAVPAAAGSPSHDRVPVAQLSAALSDHDSVYAFHGPRIAMWFGVGALLAVGLFVMLNLYGERLKHSLSGRQPAAAQDGFPPAATTVTTAPQPSDDALPRGELPGGAAMQVTPASAVGGQPLEPAAQPSLPAPPSGSAVGGLFWVLACDASGEPAFRLGMACSLDGKRLVTTASIVEALRTLAQQGFPVQQVVHCQSKQRIPITASGVHPLFARWLARSRSLEQQYMELRALAQQAAAESADPAAPATADELADAGVPAPYQQLPEQMKQLAHEELALRDRMLCYDAGWLDVSQDRSLEPWQLGAVVPTLPRPLQPVRLALAVIDAEDPYYDATAEPLTQTLDARVHRLVRPPDADTGRMEIRLQRSLDDWNVAGAPVLDSAGRLLGLFVQPSVPQDEPDAFAASPTVLDGAAQRGDVVLPPVILEALQAADSL